MGKKSGHDDGVVKYGFEIDLNELGYPTKVKVTDVKAGEEDAMRAGIKGAAEEMRQIAQCRAAPSVPTERLPISEGTSG